MSLVHNERRKLLATVLNNLGVACVVTGGIAPAAAYVIGSLQVEDPLRLASAGVVWLAIGAALFRVAQRALEEMRL